METNHKLHVLTGNGKGKTSAAVGMAARFAGHGGKVLFTQFLKNGSSGELVSLKKLGVLLSKMPPPSKFISDMLPEERQNLSERYEEAVLELNEMILREEPGLVILDELSVALSLGILSEENGRVLVTTALSRSETVVTGRNAPIWLHNMSDYETVLSPVRHPYEAEGLAARLGIEY